MMVSKRLLVLAGCTLILVACTQDTATAPPASADIVAEGIPGATGSEGGTLTFTKNRDILAVCNLKVALRGLFDDTETPNDYYMLMAGATQYSGWGLGTIDDYDISRGSFRGTMNHFDQEWKGLYLWLGYDRYGTIEWTKIGKLDPLEVTDPDFRLVNRCF